MPSPCTTPTRPKAGQPEFFFFDPIVLPPPFNSIAAWLTGAALSLPNTPVRTAEFCTTYPDGDLPTTEDWLKLAFPPIALATGTYTRLGNFVKQQVFSERCECSPAGGVGCIHREGVVSWTASGPAGSRCGTNTYYLSQDAGLLNFPAGQHYVRVRIPITTTHDVQFDLYTPSIPERCFTWLAGTAFDIQFSANLSDPWLEIAFRDGGNRPLWLEGQPILVDFSNTTGEPPCSGTGSPIPAPQPEPPPANYPAPPVASCSTIADVCTQLSALLLRVSQIQTAVTLLQRWGKPFGYVHGQEHANLTGTGQLPIARLLGMEVYVVTPPPGEPVLPGNPPYLWDVGWMSINDANGMLEEKRITRSGFDWLPRDMPLATSFNYALNPGVVLTVRELVPEP